LTLLDLGQIVDLIVALAVVALPVETGILLFVHRIKREVTDPERRSALIAEAAEQLWEPFKNPEQRAELIHEFAQKVWEPLSTPEARQKLLNEIWTSSPIADPEQRQKLTLEFGHTVMRALSERAGSLRGAAARQEKAGIVDAALQSGNPLGLLGALPAQIELPVVGKVTPGQALQLFQALRGAIGGQGGLSNLLQTGNAGTTTSAGSGYPP
jgi:hypothetical protein